MHKCVIFSSFYSNPSYVGTRRIERFIRCLAGRRDMEVVLVSAALTTTVEQEDWGTHVRIARGARSCPGLRQSRRMAHPALGTRTGLSIPNLLHRLALYPDAGVVWGVPAALHPLVRKHCRGAAWIIASSPPESCHLGAYLLSKLVRAAFIMDMRDGWLDEPLKAWIQKPGVRRTLEGRLEAKLVRRAACVFVTSSRWRRMLEARYPEIHGKTRVLLSACPPDMPTCSPAAAEAGALRLLHAGRLQGSHKARNLRFFSAGFEALLDASASLNPEVAFLGDRSPQDAEDMDALHQRFHNREGRVVWLPPVTSQRARQHMVDAAGLLLLNASPAAIPSKLFDYVATGRPILIMSRRDTAIVELADKCPQAFLFLVDEPGNRKGVTAFLRAAAQHTTWPVPEFCLETEHARQLFCALGLDAEERDA